MRTHIKPFWGFIHGIVIDQRYASITLILNQANGEGNGKNIPKYVAEDVSESYKNVSEGRDAVLMIFINLVSGLTDYD